MEYRSFGNTGLQVSALGFGAWAIGGGAKVGTTAIGWGDADDDTSKKSIVAALDQGINFFDTADIYGLGHSKKLLGEALYGNKEAIIATKVGNVARDGQFTFDYSKEYILTACEQSLRRLKRDHIHYYQLHTARMQHLHNGECMEAMQQLEQDGKILHWGLSLNTFEPEPEAQWLMEQKKGAGFQLVLNLINQKAGGLIQQAAANGYGIIARMPLQFGLLTGKFDSGVSFAINDHRKTRVTKEIVATSNELLQPVWDLCDKYKCNKTELALNWVLGYTGVSTVIAGMRSPQQVEANCNRFFVLDDADRKLIDGLWPKGLSGLMNMIQKQG